jgi:hypothetical protein
MTKRSTKSSIINWRHEPKGPGYAEHVYVTLTDGRRAELLAWDIPAQDLSRSLIASIADLEATQTLRQQGAKPGDAFDMEIGGRVDASAGEPVRIKGTVLNAVEAYGQFWVTVSFGRGNVLMLSSYLVQLVEP